MGRTTGIKGENNVGGKDRREFLLCEVVFTPYQIQTYAKDYDLFFFYRNSNILFYLLIIIHLRIRLDRGQKLFTAELP